MKSFILIAVLSALTVYNDAASTPEEIALFQEQATLFAEEGFVYREDTGMYQKGEVRLGDYLLYEQTSNVPGIPNTVQFEDVVYIGNLTTRITGLRTSSPQFPALGISVGALGNTFLNVRFRSTPGGGIFSRAQFWGHYTDWV